MACDILFVPGRHMPIKQAEMKAKNLRATLGNMDIQVLSKAKVSGTAAALVLYGDLTAVIVSGCDDREKTAREVKSALGVDIDAEVSVVSMAWLQDHDIMSVAEHLLPETTHTPSKPPPPPPPPSTSASSTSSLAAVAAVATGTTGDSVMSSPVASSFSASSSAPLSPPSHDASASSRGHKRTFKDAMGSTSTRVGRGGWGGSGRGGRGAVSDGHYRSATGDGGGTGGAGGVAGGMGGGGAVTVAQHACERVAYAVSPFLVNQQIIKAFERLLR